MRAYDETDPRALNSEEIKEVQKFRLREVVKRAYENSRFYRRIFKEKGITPDDIRYPEDLARLPFTTKDSLRENAYPHGGDFLAVPFDEIIGFHMTSGTTGIPTVNAYTRKDIETWSQLVARCLNTAGVNKYDIVMNIYGYGLFTGGIGLHQGVQRLGAKVIPWSIGRIEALVKALKDFNVTVITGTPSYELLIAETMRKLNVDPKDLNLRLAIPGAEAMNKEILERIEEEFALNKRGGGAREIYGLTEALGPGVAQECPYDHHNWMHIWTDHYLVEIIDPDTGEVLENGEEGEMVLTTLTKEGMPLIRYRTRDITSMVESDDDIPYPKIKIMNGRIDDVIFYKGVKLYPNAISSVVMGHPEIQEFQIVIDKRERNHKLILRIEIEQPSDIIMKKLVEEIRSVSFVTPDIEFVKPGSLPRYEGKGKRVIKLE